MTMPLQNLMVSMRQAALTATTPSFAAALCGVIGAYDSVQARTSNFSMDRSLQTMTNALASFAASDIDLISPSSWTMAASAVHTAGLLVSRRGETPASAARVNDIYIAASHFSSHTRQCGNQRRSVAPRELFFNDRALADTILTLKGWWNPGTFEPEVLEPLAGVLTQVGLASGTIRWPQQGTALSNLAGAIWVFFDGGNSSLFEGVKLLRPFTYFQAAALWRPGTLGFQEMLLASVLDGDSIAKTNAIAQGLPEDVQNDETLARMRAILDEGTTNDWNRHEILENLIGVSAPVVPDMGESRHDANLPAFLSTAREPLN